MLVKRIQYSISPVDTNVVISSLILSTSVSTLIKHNSKRKQTSHSTHNRSNTWNQCLNDQLVNHWSITRSLTSLQQLKNSLLNALKFLAFPNLKHRFSDRPPSEIEILEAFLSFFAKFWCLFGLRFEFFTSRIAFFIGCMINVRSFGRCPIYTRQCQLDHDWPDKKRIVTIGESYHRTKYTQNN